VRTYRPVKSFAQVLAGAFLLAAGLGGCRSGPAPDNGEASEGLRFHNWWNYYRRGGEIGAAREDFERCMGLRPGAKYGYRRDKWRARTYGMHVLEGYYPNRELGICLFLLGEMAGAEKHLSISLQQQPSGRAKHYMNRVRRARLDAARVPPPRLELDTAGEAPWTHARSFVLTGRAEGEGYVRDLLINGEPEFIELAEPSLTFSRTIPLQLGRNEIRIEARDLLGRETLQTLRVMADWRGPELLIRSIAREADGWRGRGVCLDDDRIESATLLFGDVPTALLKPSAARPRLEVEFTVADGRPAWFEATDRAGNTLRVDLARLVHALLESAPVQEASVRPVWLARDEPESRDLVRPGILVNGPLVATIYQDAYYLDGQIDDRGGLASVTLDGRELLPAAERGILSYAFSQRFPLGPGENRFELVARDMAGNRSAKQLVLTRELPPALDRRYRLFLGLPPPLCDPALNERLFRRLYSAFEEEPVRFNVLADTAAWSAVPADALTDGGVDLDPYLALARKLRTELLVVCSVAREGAGRSIYARVVDPCDGQILFVEDVYSETLEEDLTTPVAGLVSKIERRFPLFRAAILKAARGQFIIDKGAEDGVRTKAKVIVTAPPPANEQAGAVRMAGGAPVELRVTRADRDRGVAELATSRDGETIQKGDLVFAK
jgi:hypothetical protein